MTPETESPPESQTEAPVGEGLESPPCSLLSIPIETVEGIIFDAMESMNKHAATLVPVLNEHKSTEASEAYKSGVYAVSMKLGMLIGLDGIKRQKARYAKIEAELKDYFERRASKANGEPSGPRNAEITHRDDED